MTVSYCARCSDIKTSLNCNKNCKTKDGFQRLCKGCHKLDHTERLTKLTPEELVREKKRLAEKAKKNRARRNANLSVEHRPKNYKERRLNLRWRATYMLQSCKTRFFYYSDDFNLTHEWVIENLTRGTCSRSGITFDLGPPPQGINRNPFGPSIDRIDSKKGYTQQNCQIVCNMYNAGKGQHSDDEFISFCRKLIQHVDECSAK